MTISPSQPIRVMLVDDHTMVRRGLATFLKAFDDLQLAGEAESGEAAIQLCAEIQPDVILMDMSMPGMDGATATLAIHTKFPQIKVIVLTSFKEGKLIKAALEAGAIGYLLKDLSADELVWAIRAAHAGRATLSPEAAQALVESSNLPPVPGLDLTEREREVLALLIEGLNNTQIAGRLIVSPSTIKSHVSNILAKLGVTSRTEAVALALRNGIVLPPPVDELTHLTHRRGDPSDHHASKSSEAGRPVDNILSMPGRPALARNVTGRLNSCADVLITHLTQSQLRRSEMIIVLHRRREPTPKGCHRLCLKICHPFGI